MDGLQFDNIARMLASSQHRRRFLRGAIALCAGAIGLRATMEIADAGSTCSGADGSCASNKRCCNGYTCLNTSCCPAKNVCLGTCCQSPANGSAVCTGSGCVYSCNTGYFLCGNKCIKRDPGSCCSGADCGPYNDPVGTSWTCMNGTCQKVCLPGYAFLNGDCVPCNTNTFCNGNCCAAPPNADAYCGPGCQWTCKTGFKKCGNTCIPNSGCCTTADCPSAPANSTVTCQSNVCGFTCNSGWGNCDSNDSNGCETNLTDSEANCGSCGNACPAGDLCCGSACKDIDTDESNCGACGTVCAAGETCCGGGCTDLDTDDSNCGSCGNACTGGDFCYNGGCVECVAADDCPNYGAANTTTTCESNVCVYTCNAGYGNCSGGFADGCETNTDTDVDNCGECGTVCANSPENGTDVCRSGQCGIDCDSGYQQCQDRCILDTLCCRDSECNSAAGEICLDDGTCGCEFETCNGACCAEGEICDNGSCVGGE